MSYFKNIFTTGALAKTPSRVLKKIAKAADLPNLKMVVELGAGKGEITKNLVKRLESDCRYAAFEINNDFAAELKRKFPQIDVYEEDALNFTQWVNQNADLVICSLPLSFFEKNERSTLLEKIKQNTAPGGKVVILFHAFWIIPELKEVFPRYELIRLFHLPPYYIITYTK
ncbi:class I SAM-dependent methyltransferase [Terrimonas alba]|uniref:class I SAM-dependent methyltransferase n=1 Tax=Terrimonas alba TaxID=3349636 RepID=UPI0035F2ED74